MSEGLILGIGPTDVQGDWRARISITRVLQSQDKQIGVIFAKWQGYNLLTVQCGAVYKTRIENIHRLISYRPSGDTTVG